MFANIASKNNIRKCLINGYGSIGSRHAAILDNLNNKVACVTSRECGAFKKYASTKQALLDFQPDICVIANATSHHMDSLKELEACAYSGTVLVEKPLCDNIEECDFRPSFKTFVGYNMRFHPVISRIRKIIATERIVAATFSVGQYLPDWRKGRDYRACYSASRKNGGGVLRDLSHELDTASFLFGACSLHSARCLKTGNLEIDTEDWVDINLSAEKCPVIHIHLDYLDRNSHRIMTLHTDNFTCAADLINRNIVINGISEKIGGYKNDSYTTQLSKLCSRDFEDLCTWEEGVETMRLIAEIEAAQKQTL